MIVKKLKNELSAQKIDSQAQIFRNLLQYNILWNIWRGSLFNLFPFTIETMTCA
jgi:hypothetical protein